MAIILNKQHLLQAAPLGFLLLCLSSLSCSLKAEETFRYPERSFAGGKLHYQAGIPILEVAGSPEEIGRQITELCMKPARPLLKYPQDSLRLFNIDYLWGPMLQVGKSMLPHFPADYRTELETIAEQMETGRAELIAANTMFDIKKFFQCSTLLVEPPRCPEGPLLGRNLDFPTLGYLDQYSLVTIYQQPGKHTFASVGFPGLLGVLSGMNDVGLSVAVLEVYQTKAATTKFNVEGIPYSLCHRRVLEECETVEEALKLLESMPRTTLINLAVCDRDGGAVFEITPHQIKVRRAIDGVCASTNHFVSPELATNTGCWRFPILAETRKQTEVHLDDIANKLHRVNQGRLTLQTMIFQPRKLTIHLALGTPPTSRLPLTPLDLKPYFQAPSTQQAEILSEPVRVE
ncbi:Choloylglycine hydrolase [Planctomycetales bacterium 10988]|nr:Choloylglycine hydrolase [Planctomycetales bacterium 10988]